MSPLPAAWRCGGVAVAVVPYGTAWARLPGLLGWTGAIVLGRSDRGKPLVAEPAGAACSVAHRAGHSLVAAGWIGAVGADLEVVRDDLPLGEIAETCFSRSEADWLRGVPDGVRALGFTLVWAVKEAVLKASGQGIAAGLAAPAVPVDALAPLLAGAPCLELVLAGLDCVQLRQGVLRGVLGSVHAVACVAAASPASEPRATAESRPLPER